MALYPTGLISDVNCNAYAAKSQTHSQYLTSNQDLSNYATLTGYGELTNKIITAPTIKRPSLTDTRETYSLTVHTVTSNTTIATMKDLEGYSTTSHTHSTYATKTGTEELTNKTIAAPTIKNPKLRDSSTTYNLIVHSLTANAVIATQA